MRRMTRIRLLSDPRHPPHPRSYASDHLSAFLQGIHSHSLRVGSSSRRSRRPITPLLPAEATVLPSELKATDQTVAKGSLKATTFWRLFTSQTLMPRNVPATRVFPSGLKATQKQGLMSTSLPLGLNLCSVAVRLPLFTSQRRTEPYTLPEARVLPSGLKATDRTTSGPS